MISLDSSPSRSKHDRNISLSCPASPSSSWMPDEACNHCYNCDRPFSLFRRRHHCRKCGQIFCASCSGNIIDSGRACDYCSSIAKYFSSCNQNRIAPELSLSCAPNCYIDEIISETIYARVQATVESLNSKVDATAHLPFMELAIQASSALEIWPNHGDNRDPRQYVQICADAESSQSFCMIGCVINKAIAHRRMRTKIMKPKIVLLQGALEYDRNPCRMTSLTSVREGEVVYLKILIAKIMQHSPDLLLTHRSISGHALSLLLHHGVTCIVNVSQDDLQRIARCTGASVLESVDQIAGNLGTCRIFYASRASDQPACFFEGCLPASGSTIVMNCLNDVVTKLMSNAIVHAYNAKCEISLERILGANYCDVSKELSGTSYGLTISASGPDFVIRRMHIAESWPCSHHCDAISFYQQGDLSLREFLCESFLFPFFTCNDCRRSPLQHTVVFEQDSSRITLQLGLNSRVTNSEITTWALCSICAAPGNICSPPEPVPVHALQISFYRFLQLYVVDKLSCCRACNHKLRTEHVRQFSFNSFTLTITYIARPHYSISPNLYHNASPNAELAVSPEVVSRFIHLANACLDDFRTFSTLRVEVDEFRDLMMTSLHQSEMTGSKLSRIRFDLLNQAKSWNQSCKRSSASPLVSMSALDGDSLSASLALALASASHQEAIQGLDSREASLHVLLNDNNDGHLTVVHGTSDSQTSIVFFPRQSAALRRLTVGDSVADLEFAVSLSDFGEWMASGGKSDATFGKSRDGRFVIKVVKKKDINMFKQMGLEYYRYMGSSLSSGRPTILIPIIGVFRVVMGSISKHIIVLPNLFYGMNRVHKVFDLKGCVRVQRHSMATQNPPSDSSAHETATLLDGNLLTFTGGMPLTLCPTSLSLLKQALKSDTTFLASRSIVDYSVLFGLDSEKQQISLAIIDYLRPYSIDAMLETQVKSLGMLAGLPLPTVIPPHDYRIRFCRALSTYFGLEDSGI